MSRFGSALLAAMLVSTTASAQPLSIPFTKTTLKNGMVVILHEDHTLPITVVNVLYHVGSRMEAPRRTGFAHLFEHLMFMGTNRVPTKMFDAWMEGAGGMNNAGTGNDHTDYYDIAPSTALPLLLWLEADRMRDLGPLMTLAKLNAQRDVVRNERRQTSENEPYGVAELLLPELLYATDHPYHHPTIGSHEDLEAATVDDVKQFFATWYDPANASLVVAGDFDAKETTSKIERLFASIPSHGRPKDPGAPGFDDTKTTLTSVVRKTIDDRVELARTYMVWQSPKHYAPGDAELDLLSTILAGGKASRLYKRLVYEAKLAQDVEAVQDNGVLGSQFRVVATARPGVSLDALEAAIDKELDAARAGDPSDAEMTRAKNLIDATFVTALQRVAQRASLLNMYQADVGDPGYIDKDRERYRRATAADVRAWTQKTLLPNARVILRVVPRKESNEGGAR
jgi:predicted Zn-dependent peptidase